MVSRLHEQFLDGLLYVYTAFLKAFACMLLSLHNSFSFFAIISSLKLAE